MTSGAIAFGGVSVDDAGDTDFPVFSRRVADAVLAGDASAVSELNNVVSVCIDPRGSAVATRAMVLNVHFLTSVLGL